MEAASSAGSGGLAWGRQSSARWHYRSSAGVAKVQLVGAGAPTRGWWRSGVRRAKIQCVGDGAPTLDDGAGQRRSGGAVALDELLPLVSEEQEAVGEKKKRKIGSYH